MSVEVLMHNWNIRKTLGLLVYKSVGTLWHRRTKRGVRSRNCANATRSFNIFLISVLAALLGSCCISLCHFDHLVILSTSAALSGLVIQLWTLPRGNGFCFPLLYLVLFLLWNLKLCAKACGFGTNRNWLLWSSSKAFSVELKAATSTLVCKALSESLSWSESLNYNRSRILVNKTTVSL